MTSSLMSSPPISICINFFDADIQIPETQLHALLPFPTLPKPHYSEQLLAVPWPFIIVGFHCIEIIIHVLPLQHTFASSKYGKKILGRTKSFSSRLLIHGKLGQKLPSPMSSGIPRSTRPRRNTLSSSSLCGGRTCPILTYSITPDNTFLSCLLSISRLLEVFLLSRNGSSEKKGIRVYHLQGCFVFGFKTKLHTCTHDQRQILTLTYTVSEKAHSFRWRKKKWAQTRQ